MLADTYFFMNFKVKVLIFLQDYRGILGENLKQWSNMVDLLKSH